MATPAAPIPFTRLLRVEWRKSIDTRAARWLLAAIALLTAGAAMVPLFLPQEIQQGWLSYLAMTALVLALLSAAGVDPDADQRMGATVGAGDLHPRASAATG